MEFTMSTFAESSKPIEAPAAAPAPVVATETTQVAEETSPAETSTTVVNNEGSLQSNETVTTINEASTEEIVNSYEMAMPVETASEATTQITNQPQVQSWQDAIKNVDRKEILKALGVSDFSIEMDEHVSKGGQPVDYLYARAIDYNKVSDIDLLKGDFDKKYPTLSPEERTAFFNDVYKQGEFEDEAQKGMGMIRLKADAHNLRQAKIAEQQSFKIPEQAVQQPQVQQPDLEAQAAANRKYITENEATQYFLQSKRVAIPLGEKDSFNFNISDPNYLIKVMTHSDAWAKNFVDKQGEPDINRMIRIAKYAIDPDAHDMQIFNYGQQKGERKKVEGNSYISKPTVKTGIPTNETLGQAFATRAKISTYGGQ